LRTQDFGNHGEVARAPLGRCGLPGGTRLEAVAVHNVWFVLDWHPGLTTKPSIAIAHASPTIQPAHAAGLMRIMNVRCWAVP